MKIRKIFVLLGMGLCLPLASPLVTRAQNTQVLKGTPIRLTLLNSLSTAASRDGDPFAAVVSEPVYYGGRLILPAGTRVNGQVGSVVHPRRFPVFRGQAYLNLTFRSIEVDNRLIPVQMSILALENPSGRAASRRKDIKVVEGQVVEAKRDIKGDVVAATIGTGGGTLIGAIFSHAARGFGIGAAGSAVYVVARKGKDVELPSQTILAVRLDNTLSLPTTGSAAYNSDEAH
jgi:hypothetical protein